MAKLIYIANVSLDLCIEDAQGSFDWSEPDEELFTFITELIRPVGTHLYGRRMYETMSVWETDPSLAAQSELQRDFAEVWQGADKVAHSTSLSSPLTDRTRIERDLDLSALRQLKESATSDLTVGGADFTGQVLTAGLVDELHLFVYPVFVGGGKPALPRDIRLDLQLLEERRFRNGVVHLHYLIRN
jgi:dihydrofolate reductase